MAKSHEPDEDVLIETYSTKITSHVIDGCIVVSHYVRYAKSNGWEFTDDWKTNLSEFEDMKDTMEYLLLKYKVQVKKQ